MTAAPGSGGAAGAEGSSAAAAGSAGVGAASAPPASPDLEDALLEVHDPETGLSVVDMGLIYETRWEPRSAAARVRMTLTTPGCPVGGAIVDGVRRRLLALPGVREAEVEVTFDPPWRPERISALGRLQLGW